MDKDKLSEFYIRYSREIYLYLYSMCRNKECAEDLLQETFLKALLSWEDKNGNLRAWLYKVARNACLNYLKNRGRETVWEDDLLQGFQESPVEKLIRDEEKLALYHGMMELPIHQREILELFYFSEMHVKEIALLMGISAESVRVLAFRARKNLRKYMEVNGHDI